MDELKLEAAVFLTTNLFLMYSIHLMLETFLGWAEQKKGRTFLSYGMFYVLNSITFLRIQNEMLTLIIFVLCLTVTAIFCYEQPPIPTLLIVLFVCVILFCIEFLSGYLVAIMRDKPLEVILKSKDELLLIIVLTKLLQFSTAILLHFRFKREKDIMYIPDYWILLLLIPICSICLVFVIFSSNKFTNMNTYNIAMMICVTLLLFMNIWLFYLFEKMTKEYKERIVMEEQKSKIQAYQENQKIQQDTIWKLESYRHDTKSYYLSIKAYLEAKNYEMAKKRIDEELLVIQEIPSIIQTSNPEIDVLLNHKIAYATSQGIKVSTKISISDQLSIQVRDLYTVINNLFDNAIEGCETVNDKRISFSMKADKGYLLIEIHNPYKGIIQKTHGLPASTKADKQSHGYGLRNISDMVDKYDGCIQIDTESPIFRVIVSLSLVTE